MVYRFRKIESLLGKYKELERQEIYFASPQELNDPVEGFQDIFWDGDEIIWKNFLKHYLSCLEEIFQLYVAIGETKPIIAGDIPIFGWSEKMNQVQFTKLKQKIETKFFNISFIKDFPLFLSKRNTPIRRNELTMYLKVVHFFALSITSKVYKDQGVTTGLLFPDEMFDDLTSKLNQFDHLVSMTNKLESELKNVDSLTDKFFSVITQVISSYSLARQVDHSEDKGFSNYLFLFDDFIGKYLIELEKLTYPRWYAASFLENYNNSSVWGSYGDNHKGVCLIFDTAELEGKDGLSLYNKEKVYSHTFHKVNYEGKHPGVDFFRSLGRVQRMILDEVWYKGENGNKSVCAKDIEENEETWREKYWQRLYDSATTKLKDWEFEKEQRLIIIHNLNDYSRKELRRFKYRFQSLKGIIFGIKTSDSDKKEIIRIIKRKCQEVKHADFEFYQAIYSKESGKIEKYRLNILEN